MSVKVARGDVLFPHSSVGKLAFPSEEECTFFHAALP